VIASGTGSSASAGSIISLVETAKELSGDDELVGVSVATDYTTISIRQEENASVAVFKKA